MINLVNKYLNKTIIIFIFTTTYVNLKGEKDGVIGSDSGKITVQMFTVTVFIATLNYTFDMYILN